MTRLTDDELEELRESFEYHDTDADGKIQLDEFIAMMNALDEEISSAEARTGFAEIDTNDDGLIDFEEFVDWWRED